MPRVHVFARDHINTDEIIPARYLTTDIESELAKFAMEDYDKDFVNRVKPGDIMVTGADFGCGSSREHAVWCLRGAGVSVILAPNFARIFYRNAINNGFLALESEDVVAAFEDGDEAEIDMEASKITNQRTGQSVTFQPVPQFALDVKAAGGWLEYMRDHSKADLEAETLDTESTQAGHGHPGHDADENPAPGTQRA